MGLSANLTFDLEEDVSAPFLIGSVTRPKIAVLREQGINGQLEMAAAFDRAGFKAFDVHIDTIAGKKSITRSYLQNQIKILLSSTLAEVKRRGSLITEIKVDSNSIQKIFTDLDSFKENSFMLEAISKSNSDKVDKVNVILKSNQSTN